MLHHATALKTPEKYDDEQPSHNDEYELDGALSNGLVRLLNQIPKCVTVSTILHGTQG